MVNEECRLTIPALQGRVAVVCDFVAQAARRAGLDDRGVHHCQLAVDETCTNIIEHGYGGENEDRAIDVLCRNDAGRFSITVSDDSPPFDPLRKPDPDTAAQLEDRQPGGWGIYFIKKVMDEVFYRYQDGRNALMLVKRVYEYPAPERDRRGPARVSIEEARPGVWVLTPHGRLDADLCPGLNLMISEQWDAGRRQLVVDMADVDYISSIGLKTLVGMWQRAQKTGGALVLAGLTDRVRESLEIIGLDHILACYGSADEAADSLAS